MAETEPNDDILDALITTSLDPALAMSADGRIVAWNDLAEELFGWSFAQANGQKVRDLVIPPEDRRRHDLGLRSYLKTGLSVLLGKHIEVTALDSVGRRFPAELSTTVFMHNGEQIFLGFVRDITGRKKMESELADVGARLALAVSAHSIGIFDTNVATGQVLWSKELEAIFGFAPGAFPKNLDAWRCHVLPSDLRRVDREFGSAIAQCNNDLTYNYRIRRLDGAVRNIEASARLFYDSAGAHVRRVGVNIDVTERKKAEVRLAESRAELAHLARIGSLGAMASTLGHELNQPLAAIANYLASATAIVKNETFAKRINLLEQLESARENTMRAAELIKHLRAMILKKQRIEEQVSIREIVVETASLAIDNFPNFITDLQFEIGHNADQAFYDPLLLQQVFFNLLKNSSEAMGPSPGQIIVRTSVTEPTKILVEVIDNGPGFAPEIRDRLFSAFITSKPGGMGVGLSVCRTIVESHDGRIWTKPMEKGAHFLFTVPRYSELSQN